jgi:plasmid replication initiation protein
MTKETALQKHRAKGYEAAKLDRPVGERWVTMSNALTSAAHGLTLGEKRVIAWAVSTLDSRQVLKPGEVPTTRISAMDYATEFEVDSDTAYNQLQGAAKALYNRSITFYEPAHKRNGNQLPPTMVRMRWVGEAKYQAGEGWIELAWWPKLLPHLTGLRQQFTSYQLQQASALRSVYSWRLLELLTRFKSTGKAEYTIEDFKASMDAPPSLSDFGQVKRRIIDPAVKELTQKDGWLIQWEPIKAGRKVKSLRFTFTRNPQGSLDL